MSPSICNFRNVATLAPVRGPAGQRRNVATTSHRASHLGEWDTRTTLDADVSAPPALPASESHAARLVTGYQCVGQRPDLWTHVGDIMQTSRAFTTPGTPLAAAAMHVKHAGGLLPVVDQDGHLVGLLSQRDCRKPGECVADVMADPLAVQEGEAIRAAAELLLEKGLDRLPVTNATGLVVGWLSRSELFWALAEDSDAVRPH